mgnify:CR=1 FL=1
MKKTPLKAPINLKTNSRINPENIGDIMPKFSWKALNQTSYQIKVWDYPDEESSKKRTIWDSGKILSKESYCYYQPLYTKKLRTHHKYYWQVRTFDSKDKSSGWSDMAWFQLKVPMPPKWALGLWISRYNYETAQICLDIAKTFRKKHIPCDVIHPDLKWETVEHPTADFAMWDSLGDMKWNTRDFPNPRAFLKKLHSMGFKFCPIDHHQLRKEGPYTEKAVKLGLTTKDENGEPHWQKCWSGGGYIIDFTKEEGRKYFEDVILKPLYQDGIDVFKVDNAWYKQTDGGIPANGEPPYALHHLLTKSHFDARRKHTGERGLAYSHDYNDHAMYPAWWTGDIYSKWEVLDEQIAQIIRNALIGQLCTSSDIGGFYGECNPELYARWFSWGMFCPICRPHGMKQDREPWRFGKKTEDICRKYAQLRYRLLPYIYTYIYNHHQYGSIELAMPLEKAFPHDPKAKEGWEVKSIKAGISGNDPFADTSVFQSTKDFKPKNYLCQHMFGREMMIAPITKKGATSREVYLPRGANWIDFWSDKKYAGGKTIRYKAPLDVVPVFVRSGSIIPMGPEIEYIDLKHRLDPLYLEVYPPDGDNTAAFVLYEDDGISEDYLKGQYVESAYICMNTEDGILVSICGEHGKYKGKQKIRKTCLRLHVDKKIREVMLNGITIPCIKNEKKKLKKPFWKYSKNEKIVEVWFLAEPDEEWHLLAMQ